jgi:effector-binding domain-containing protein
MISEPTITERGELGYLGIRTLATIPELPQVIPQLHEEVYSWLEQQGVEPAGAPFIRYHVINMETKLDIEIGVPVAGAVAGNGRIASGTLPAGRYASVLYTGDYSGLMHANSVLIGWARDNGVAWDNWQTEQGDAFGSRIEIYITDPGNEPDPSRWETEVAIKLADS